MEPEVTLTPREREIAVLTAEGLSIREIATKLGIAEKTVKQHRSKIREKLNGAGIALMTRYVIRQGWVQA